MNKKVGIKFKPTGKVYDFDCGAFVLNRGDHVIVETEQGLGFGTVAVAPSPWGENPPGRPLKKVYRLANEKDLQQLDKNLADEKTAYAYCLKCIKELGLKMNLFSVEKSFEGNKYTFFSHPKDVSIFVNSLKCWLKSWLSGLKCVRWAFETRPKCAEVSAAADGNCVVRHIWKNSIRYPSGWPKSKVCH